MASAPLLDSHTADILRQAMNAAQAGKLNEAQAIAEAALVRDGDPVALNAFLGMLRARAGDMAGAIRHLRAAHDRRPGDTTIACNLISALLDIGDQASALDIATQKLALADGTLRIARYRGFLSQSLELFPDAIDAYAHVVRYAPQDFESWNNLGNARSAVGDLEGSVVALQRAMDLNPLAAPTRLNLAVALRNAGKAPESEALLRKAAEEFPEDARVLYELYVQYKVDNRQEEALAALEQAITRDAEDADLQLKFAIECGLVQRIEDAERAFRNTIRIDPRIVDAYLGLAVQYEHTNREEEFAPLIALAEANGVEENILAFLRALEHRRQSRFEPALACLAMVPAEIEPERVAHLRGTILDRLGRTEEAFAAFVETNRLNEASPTAPAQRAEDLRQKLRTELQLMTPTWVNSWPSLKTMSDRSNPTFLVGFPRSGTTLLDTILMGHPDTIVMEEKPPLNHVEKKVGGIAGIPALDAQGVIDARNQYFAEAGAISPIDPSRLLIDKSPLFLNKVPLIQRLFPNARFILAMRHPCDVVLSCFMSNFRLNAAMSNFLRLEDAAQFYDLNFRHWERARELFSINVHTIVYERLVENVETEVRPLFDFLGLDWRGEALDHVGTAKSRGLITTASYSQVTEPIYKRASGRWERYRHHLEPILPTLAPWVEKFGYSL